jgi:hypothetical protein
VNFTNATLTEIAEPGLLGPSGDPGEPVVIWTGRARGYLKRLRRTVISGGEDVRLKRDIFTILNSAGSPPVETAGPDWQACTVVIDDERETVTKTRRFTIRGAENRAAGTPVDSVRLELDAEVAA